MAEAERAGAPADPGAPRPAPALNALRRVGAALLVLPRLAWAGVAIGWAGLIWYLSSQTMEQAPGGPLWRFLANGVHVPLFGLLALWLALALPRTQAGERTTGRVSGWPALRLPLAVGCAALAALWGAIDEWHQSTTGRTPSVFDWITDAVAASWVVTVATLAGARDADAGRVSRALGVGLVLVLVAVALATVF